MSTVNKNLSLQEKANLVAAVHPSFNNAIASMRKKMIEDNYLTSASQVATLDKILLTVKDNENNNLHKVIFENLVSQKQLTFINNIKEMFKEGWMLSKAFRFYTGGADIKTINAWSMKSIISVIDTKDKSKFEMLGLNEDKKSLVKKPFNQKSKVQSADSNKKVIKKVFKPKPKITNVNEISITIKKAT